jgi:hypothetical protein
VRARGLGILVLVWALWVGECHRSCIDKEIKKMRELESVLFNFLFLFSGRASIIGMSENDVVLNYNLCLLLLRLIEGHGDFCKGTFGSVMDD